MESKNGATGGLCSNAYKRSAAELAYQRRIEASLQEEMYFKVFIVSWKNTKLILNYLTDQ
jgi:hypothetical protein